ncbi:hypothetical protein ACH6CV_01000 [Bacillota bacterium Meth-B3]
MRLMSRIIRPNCVVS